MAAHCQWPGRRRRRCNQRIPRPLQLTDNGRPKGVKTNFSRPVLEGWISMSAEPAGEDVVAGEEPEYEEKLDEAPKSILMGMMRQLKVGMDLSRITLPAFILEPRSFLEKCSDFMSHGHHLLRYNARTNFRTSNFISKLLNKEQMKNIYFRRLSDTPDPTQRMLAIVRWYLSSWHLKPPVMRQ